MADNKYHGGCCYPCEFHKGKTEFHHPLSFAPDVGIYLCEAHHSILQGRKKRYNAECLIDKTLVEMRSEIIEIQNKAILAAGYSPLARDKN